LTGTSKSVGLLLSGLVAEGAVAAGLAFWIWLRADSLVRESEGLAPGFLVPETAGEAVRTGYLIWSIVSVVCGLLVVVFYAFLSRWGRRGRFLFGGLVAGAAVLVSVMAFVSKMPFAVEATGEVLIVALAFGLLMPWVLSRLHPAS
jgi:hypothetical protein